LLVRVIRGSGQRERDERVLCELVEVRRGRSGWHFFLKLLFVRAYSAKLSKCSLENYLKT